ncbi:MAG: SDR family NAD(P)-dependent oxidoreductase [Promethearchaeota archaeon]|nr:MAG: SDR family NAD(P)-dependent oxidoreductase [Candidatus Lokiarchaeota archaeon]
MQSMSSVLYSPLQETQKICMITGGTDGIGKEVALQIAHLGHRVIIVARNYDKGKKIEAEFNQLPNTLNNTVEFLQADLSLMSENRHVAAEFYTKYPRLDLLINNAGVFSPVRRETTEGLELSFALNYLSPFLLTNLLLPALTVSSGARIINIASVDHKLAKIRFKDLQSHRFPLGSRAYGQSKLALVMFTRALAQKLRSTSITVNALHPGIIRTNITNKTPGLEGFITKLLVKIVGTPMRTCVKNIVNFSLSPKYEQVTGAYYSKGRIGHCSWRAKNQQNIKRLWNISEQLLEIDTSPLFPEPESNSLP